MNIYINLDFMFWVYAISAILVLLICFYAMVVDHRKGFTIYGHDVILTIFATFTPVINTWVLICLAYDFVVQYSSSIIMKGK